MLKWIFPLNRWPLILIKPLIPFLFQRSDTLELYRRVFSSFKEQIAKSMAKLSRAKKQPVPPKDLSSLQGMVDEMKNRLSRAVAVVSVFTIYDNNVVSMQLSANPGLDTRSIFLARGQMFWHWSQAETAKKKIFSTGPNLKCWVLSRKNFDVISKFLIIDSVTYRRRIQPPP